jgi:predicted ATPase
MSVALARHDQIVRSSMEAAAGYVFATGGDGFAAAFDRVDRAVAAAVAVQRALAREPWPGEVSLRVRVGLHSGVCEERGGDYFGPTVNRAARIMAAAHGGQILCSAATAGLLVSAMPAGLSLTDLGEHRLKDLAAAERLFQIVAPGLPQAFGSLRTIDRYPTSLPVQPTHFVGRSEELGRVAKALGQARLVTLTGVGGVGKTRLALQAAADALALFPDGAWLVELAGLTDPAGVADSIASVLGVPVQPGRRLEDVLVDFVDSHQLLLVLDNCEHVIDAAAAMAGRLSTTSGGTRILATSREGLAVAGERVIAVPPLATPSDVSVEAVLSCDAVRLFVERAADARDDFSLPDSEIPVLGELCRRLDGLPLAIELAAARVRSMGTTEILNHLDRRLSFLVAGRRTAPTRQQTLRGTLDWSYGLLEEPERVLLRRLSVFAGGFDLASVEAVAADAQVDAAALVDLIDRLVDKSLVTVTLSAGTARYGLLETIRDYARERLDRAGEAGHVAGRHGEYFAELSERADVGLRGPDEIHWTAVVEIDLGNLRWALTWAIAHHQADLALRLIGGLAHGSRVGMPFGRTALQAAALPAAQGHLLQPLALASAAWSAWVQEDMNEAAKLVDRAVAAAVVDGDNPAQLAVRCRVLSVAGPVALTTPDLGVRVALARGEQMKRDAEALGDDWELTQALMLIGPFTGDVAVTEEAVRLADQLGNPSARSGSRCALASLIAPADPARARQLCEGALSAAMEVRNDMATMVARQTLTQVPMAQGDPREAIDLALESLRLALERRDIYFTYLYLAQVAASLAALGDSDTAHLLLAYLRRRGFSVDSYQDPTYMGIGSRWFANFDFEKVARLARDDTTLPRTDEDAVALVRERVKNLQADTH